MTEHKIVGYPEYYSGSYNKIKHTFDYLYSYYKITKNNKKEQN